MATLGTVNSDTAHGQDLVCKEILVLPFSAITNGDTWAIPPTAMNPTTVFFQAATATDIVGVSMNATTKNLNFATDGITSYSGNVLFFLGGGSA